MMLGYGDFVTGDYVEGTLVRQLVGAYDYYDGAASDEEVAA